MKLKCDVEHSVESNGISYRVARTEEDIQSCMNFCFENFLEGRTN